MSYDQRLKDPMVDRLFAAILLLETEDECYRFFQDLCTVGEIRSLALRWEVAQMLAGGSTYDEIVSKTGMSTATISRIKRFLNYGADGYRLVLDRLQRLSSEKQANGRGRASPLEVSGAERPQSPARARRARRRKPDRAEGPTGGPGQRE